MALTPVFRNISLTVPKKFAGMQKVNFKSKKRRLPASLP